ncbi:MAG TPA: DUF1343 domain-containing protein [Polyangiaceae bacterium]|nr:DUF1343 domain-containing protein [Polyangiaceae bacterium]
MWCGIDQLYSGKLPALRRRLRDARLGVLTHAAAVDRRGLATLDVLEELGIIPRLVFAPEHGLDAVAQAEEPVDPDKDGTAVRAGAPVISLYGRTRAELTPRPEHLAELDVLLIDLADVGSRYYTYVWTALLAARAAQAQGVHVVVLDRPNPISGDPSTLEGAPQAEGFLSFVGLEPLPIRHALTVAEILTLFLERDGAPLGPDGAISVVPTLGWERHRTAEAWGRPFVLPSPNMPTLETALVYPGGCLVEGTNLSEGRGTTTPFQIVGAPFLDGKKLAQAVLQTGVPGAWIRPVSFRPSFEKHAGTICQGVMVHVTNPRLFRPVATYLTLITLAHRMAPEAFAFRRTPYEFETEIPAFDLLTGSDRARRAILDAAPPEDVVAEVAPVDATASALVLEAEARLERALA